MIIAIDGPAGSGKSSTAREVARRLGFRHVDSGAFYRAVTWAALEAGLDPARWPALAAHELEAFAVSARPHEHGFRMRSGERELIDEIRSERVNAHVSAMASAAGVREWLNARLREAARGNDVVLDGRDIGTVVFPDAELKVFLVADPAERARRRLAERGLIAPTQDELAAEEERLLERDRLDSGRAVAPLLRADDAVDLDTTSLTFEEQVARVVQLARERGASPG